MVPRPGHGIKKNKKKLGPGCLGVLDCSVGAVLEDTGAVAVLECALISGAGVRYRCYGGIRGMCPLKAGGQVL